MAKVAEKVKFDDQNASTASYNPLHDHSVYKINNPDGLTEELTANIIAENMLS